MGEAALISHAQKHMLCVSLCVLGWYTYCHSSCLNVVVAINISFVRIRTAIMADFSLAPIALKTCVKVAGSHFRSILNAGVDAAV